MNFNERFREENQLVKEGGYFLKVETDHKGYWLIESQKRGLT